MLTLGFTGTRKGLSEKQKLYLKNIFKENPNSLLLHGGAEGADEQAHLIFRNQNLKNKIIIFPSRNLSFPFDENVEVREKEEPLKRNKIIVSLCDILLVCPKTEKEELRSGTWSTCRYAKKLGKQILIIV